MTCTYIELYDLPIFYCCYILYFLICTVFQVVTHVYVCDVHVCMYVCVTPLFSDLIPSMILEKITMCVSVWER